MNHHLIANNTQDLTSQLHMTSNFLTPTPCQNLEESPAKNLNSEVFFPSILVFNFDSQDSQMIPLSPTQEGSPEENDQSIDRTKKKEANFKHILNIHHISDIISGKRTRKAPETIDKRK